MHENNIMNSELSIELKNTKSNTQKSPSFNDCVNSSANFNDLLDSFDPNVEEILEQLGFAGSEQNDSLLKIPVRFLRPSTLKGINVEEFLKDYVNTHGAAHLPPDYIIALKRMNILPDSYSHSDSLGRKLLMQLAKP